MHTRKAFEQVLEVSNQKVLSRFEEGKPADPTENMSEEDAKKWWEMHEKNKDNFKSAMQDCPACAEKVAAEWRTMPEGWDDESRKKFWKSIGGSVTKCMEKIEGHVDDPAAFCAALKDRIEGTTGWRGKEAATKIPKLVLVTIPGPNDAPEPPEAISKRLINLEPKIVSLNVSYKVARNEVEDLSVKLSKAQFELNLAESKLRKAVANYNAIADDVDAMTFSLVLKSW